MGSDAETIDLMSASVFLEANELCNEPWDPGGEIARQVFVETSEQEPVPAIFQEPDGTEPPPPLLLVPSTHVGTQKLATIPKHDDLFVIEHKRGTFFQNRLILKNFDADSFDSLLLRGDKIVLISAIDFDIGNYTRIEESGSGIFLENPSKFMDGLTPDGIFALEPRDRNVKPAHNFGYFWLLNSLIPIERGRISFVNNFQGHCSPRLVRNFDVQFFVLSSVYGRIMFNESLPGKISNLKDSSDNGVAFFRDEIRGPNQDLLRDNDWGNRLLATERDAKLDGELTKLIQAPRFDDGMESGICSYRTPLLTSPPAVYGEQPSVVSYNVPSLLENSEGNWFQNHASLDNFENFEMCILSFLIWNGEKVMMAGNVEFGDSRLHSSLVIVVKAWGTSNHDFLAHDSPGLLRNSDLQFVEFCFKKGHTIRKSWVAVATGFKGGGVCLLVCLCTDHGIARMENLTTKMDFKAEIMVKVLCTGSWDFESFMSSSKLLGVLQSLVLNGNKVMLSGGWEVWHGHSNLEIVGKDCSYVEILVSEPSNRGVEPTLDFHEYSSFGLVVNSAVKLAVCTHNHTSWVEVATAFKGGGTMLIRVHYCEFEVHKYGVVRVNAFRGGTCSSIRDDGSVKMVVVCKIILSTNINTGLIKKAVRSGRKNTAGILILASKKVIVDIDVAATEAFIRKRVYQLGIELRYEAILLIISVLTPTRGQVESILVTMEAECF